MDNKIFGFQPQQNEHFTELVAMLEYDAKLRKGKPLCHNSIARLLPVARVALKSQSRKESMSLAVIGLVDYMISKQEFIVDDVLVVFASALACDPLIKYEERKLEISSLNDRLEAYMAESRKWLHTF